MSRDWCAIVIRVLFRQLLDNKGFSEGRRITIGEVVEETGISRATLTRVANVPGYNTNTDTLNLLCMYFECSPGDLMQLVPDSSDKKSK